MTETHTLEVERAGREAWKPMLELAAREVFEIMLATPLESAEAAASADSLDFTAMVGLAGQVCGVLTVRCTPATAALMASKMLGLRPEEVNDEVYDAAGEVCNMIAGNFKNKLTGVADKCMLSVPTVITGTNYSYHTLADSGALEAIFLFEGSTIVLSLEVHS